MSMLRVAAEICYAAHVFILVAFGAASAADDECS
jgi:hypothetical protein